MKKVMVFGTFDLLHPGHRYFLKQAKKLGDYLITVVARDTTVKIIKGRLPRQNEKQRFKIIKFYGLADKVILGHKRDKYYVIKKYRPQIIALGYDQISFTDQLANKLEEFGLLKTKVIKLKSYQPEKFKSSKLKNNVKHKIAAAIIKDKSGKILMLDRKNFPFGWACPAGHVERVETIKQALVREIKEETNLDIIKYKLFFHEYIAWNKCVIGHRGHDWYVFEIGEWQGKIKTNKSEAKRLVWQSIKKIKYLKLEPVWRYWFEKLKII